MMPYCMPEHEEGWMVVEEETWRLPVEVVFPLECPQMGERERGFTLRPENRRDWLRELPRLAQERPRCILFDLPREPVNLTLNDLRVWAREAQMHVPEIPVFLAERGAGLPCGRQAQCLHCHQAAARLLQEQISDWTEREVPTTTKIRQAFPQLDEAKQAVIAAWALEPSAKNRKQPIMVSELAARANVSPRSIRRWLLEAMEQNPGIMRRLEAYRELRLQEAKAYQVRTV